MGKEERFAKYHMRDEDTKVQLKRGFETLAGKNNRKVSALAYVASMPVDPVDVSFPLTNEMLIDYYAAREALEMASRSEETMKGLSEAEAFSVTSRRQEEGLKFVVDAVQRGKTIEEIRVGVLLAQLQKMPADQRESAKATARSRVAAMSERQIRSAQAQLLQRARKQRKVLEPLSPSERADYARSEWRPMGGQVAAEA